MSKNLKLILAIMLTLGVVISARAAMSFVIYLPIVINSNSMSDGRIVFCRFWPGGSDIYVMSDDGSGVTRLTNSGWNDWPDWSPGGTRIAYESDQEGNHEIFLMEADGKGLTYLPTAQRMKDFSHSLRTSGSVGTELAIMSGKNSTQKWQGEANDQAKKRPTTHLDRRRTGLVGADQPFTQ